MVKKELKKVGKEIEKVEKEIVKTVVMPFNHQKLTIRQRAADLISKWAGSWAFIFLFFLFLGIWMATSGIFLLKYIDGSLQDPYPFILLNLVLSCLAAIQAPVILMSQNRAVQRDRMRAEYDYAINRKSEKEIQQIRKTVNRIEEKIQGKTK
jgi:uncharacterized membrane protein|tara:strand:+ start:18811 stop:19266 length:456 start_codon:yes stop_codon:yes gene_type:complete